MVHEQTKSLNIGLVNTPLMANGHFGNFISNLSYDYNNLWFKPLIWECDQTLVFFFSRPFQWWNGSSIWTKFGDKFVSKVPTFYVFLIPKLRIHFKSLRTYFLALFNTCGSAPLEQLSFSLRLFPCHALAMVMSQG